MIGPHIAILDFGSQYMHLIARRVRQLGVRSVIYPTDVNAHDLHDAVGIILSGGPQSVNAQKLPYDPGIFDLPVPILGLCYGHQLMTHHYGGRVQEAHQSEYGEAIVHILDKGSLFSGLNDDEQVWMSHWDSVEEVPEGFRIIGNTDTAKVSAMANDELKRYGLQFHVEVQHTPNGMQMLKNFVLDICQATPNWSMEEYIAELKDELKKDVGNRKVFLFVSGGVDSSVAFAMLEEVFGRDRVYGLHVDNGFMRKGESMLVKEALAKAGFDNLQVVDASESFLKEVAKMVEPEDKRNAIGKHFLTVQKEVFAELGFNEHEWVLGQGTIYPDTIESGGTDASDTIKTHHNRIPEIVEMINKGLVVEPLSQLYKDEVRALGRELGLPDELVNRWPFPGPGLSIRCLCSDGSPEPADNESQVNEQIIELLEGTDLQGAVLPIRSVGVQGDQRSYQHPAILWGGADLAWEQLNNISTTLTNAIGDVNRVVLQVAGPVDPSHPKVVKGYLTEDRLDLLREVDAVVDAVVRERGVYDSIWQFPVILVPLSYNGGESIVLRPIESEEAMTVNFYPIDRSILTEIADKVMAINGVDAVFFDVTNKPPATIEWE
ncbi:MAG: glutamine-hydrolyzing GMP synthase [Candidatus Kerfeldbacteria bacterium CG15_BIG_FIL_POST_REV_8_21_14_020_45_12]|uniref:GMP synthase (glutamine-hydrolyzing) n=1 Tax=Candidatus Kerfeldbacteria bacterium CG15_BIG_FIL_POST_REV_8_21_14_020_45_12 TaxID=2014247 RepID=A0A2M7H365_9BACT|nr:MAG: glutamine-hydrolyzing GMP synthase [Candidatus Kerfeldbacteria bacterium CG15_BIG_FIL_POST_REV_8_21_14_020_45_12]PJA93552.1 MAG: glutamine-hydrolyzing GMP synthase [Candidatus Kerfeldbacteria bacterium CG_4_9_14_3_um_filter_45_8]